MLHQILQGVKLYTAWVVRSAGRQGTAPRLAWPPNLRPLSSFREGFGPFSRGRFGGRVAAAWAALATAWRPHGGRVAAALASLALLTPAGSGRFAALRSVHECPIPFSGGRVVAALAAAWRPRGGRFKRPLQAAALLLCKVGDFFRRSFPPFFPCITTEPLLGIITQSKTE